MMGSPTHEANGKHQDRSDLTQIRGIGAIRKRWLNSLGIDTIADLAQASADAIEAQAKSDGRTLSRDELEAWIAQAQVHHIKASLEQAESFEAIAETAQTDFKPLADEHTETEYEQHLPDWETIASFKVDYQTRQVNGKAEQRITTHHLETDAIERWSPFDGDLMQQWMSDRVETRPPLQAEKPIIADAIVKNPIIAEITQLRVMQPYYMKRPMVADQNSPIFSDVIQADALFALEVSIQFAALTEANQQAAYQVQCFARNLATGVTDRLGAMTAQFLPDRSAYTVLLPSLRLRQAGTYRLKALVTLPQAAATSGQFKVPMLQVV